MARVTSEIECLTGQLIERLSGFQDGNPNHRACLQYAVSNLRFHRFLDVDSLKVSRKIEGLCFKFSVHSQDDKGQRLRALTDSFLSSPLFCSDSDSDHHYALILMMTLLGDCPTESEYEEEQKCVEIVEDEINWQEELHHDISNWTLFSHVDNEEPWSDSEESEVIHDAVTTLHLTSEEKEKESEKLPDTQLTTNQGVERQKEFAEAFHDQLMPQYWDGEAVAESLTHEWMAGIRTVPSCQTLTESVVLRETLWLLSGVRVLYVYEVGVDDIVSVRANIQLSHVTPGCLVSSLSCFVEAGSSVMKINSFISEQNMCGHGNPLSFQGLSSALSDYMNSFCRELGKLEKSMSEGNGCLTISTLQSELDFLLKQLRWLETIVSTVRSVSGSNAEKCCCVISTLFDVLAECDVLQSSEMGVVLSLFLHTIRPYLCMIDGWMLHGFLSDPHQEFFICRSNEQSVSVHTPRYWKDAFVLQMMDGGHAGIGRKEHKTAEFSAVCLPHFLSDSKHQCDFCDVENVQILLCGKSVELMHHSDQLRHRLRNAVNGMWQNLKILNFTKKSNQTAVSQPLCLYTDLVSSLQNTFLETDDSSSSVNEMPVQRHAVSSPPNFLLSLNFQNILPACSEQTSRRSSCSLLDGCIGLASKQQWQSFEPVSLRVREALTSLINERYRQVCGTFVDWFMTDCQLNTYFTDIRQFFFMEAGHTMHSFCASLFEMVKNGERWKDVSTLNALFQHSAGEMHGHVTERLRLQVKEVEGGEEKKVLPIHELDSLQLSLFVPWPANIVISDESIHVCNRIFLFLLQIKRAKWSLDQWTWKGVCNVGRGLLHKLQLLRAKLLHFVNTLHMHIMRRILHSTGIEFEEAIAEADDVDNLADIHRHYVNKTHDRCLLNEKASYVKEAIHRSLSLALVLASKLQKGVQCISEEAVDQIDRDFQQCNHFLVSFLSSLIQRGSYPHLEYLVLALRYPS